MSLEVVQGVGLMTIDAGLLYQCLLQIIMSWALNETLMPKVTRLLKSSKVWNLFSTRCEDSQVSYRSPTMCWTQINLYQCLLEIQQEPFSFTNELGQGSLTSGDESQVPRSLQRSYEGNTATTNMTIDPIDGGAVVSWACAKEVLQTLNSFLTTEWSLSCIRVEVGSPNTE